MKESLNTDYKQISEAAFANFSRPVEEMTNKMIETSAEISEKTISTIKKYPLHTAIAAGVLGFAVGAFIVSKK